MQSSDYQRAKRRAPQSTREGAPAPSRDPFAGQEASERPAGARVRTREQQEDIPASAPATEAPAQPRRTGRVLLVLGIIAVIAAALVLAFVLMHPGAEDAYDRDAVEGQAPYKSAEEMQEELDRVVDAGMFNIAIVSSIEFERADAPGKAYIENVPANKYCMQVTIAEDATGDVLYKSGILKPNSYIEDITLERTLEPGTHEATATFTAIDPDTLEAVGETAAQIALVVKQ